MLNLVKPRYVMPFHGDFKRLRLHAQLAEAVGIDPDDIFQGDNGLPLEIDDRGARFGAREQAGMIFVDGVELGEMADVALRDRRMLSADGIFIVVVTIAEQDGSSVADPEVIFRGVPFLDEADELDEEIRDDRRGVARAGRQRAGARGRRAHPAAARRPREARLRPPQAPPDGAAGRGRGLATRLAPNTHHRQEHPRRVLQLDGAVGQHGFAGLPSGLDRGRVWHPGQAHDEARALAARRRRARRVPPCERGDGVDDREAEAERAAAVAGAADEALEQRRRRCSGDTPGPSSATIELDAAVGEGARCETLISVPGRRVPQGVLDQVDRQPVQLVARAVAARAGCDVERDLVLAADGSQLAGRLDHDLGEVAAARAAAARAASVRASSSRSATSRRIRWEERSAERAASPWSPSRDSASSSRFASTLVSGVRSSCEASATKRRWRASIVSVSPRAASSSRSMPSSVRASSATSSSASGWGMRREGSRVRAISAAAAVRSAIGAIARRAIAMPAISAQHAAGEHAEQQEQLDPLDGCLGRTTRRPYWTIDAADGSPVDGGSSRSPVG